MTTTATARAVQISDWKPREKGSLRGFFTVTLASGMVIQGCMLHEKDDRRWIGLPAREYMLQDERKFASIISFVDRATENKFRDLILAALDAYIDETEDEGR